MDMFEAFSNMYGIMSMSHDYGERLVANTKGDRFVVDTVRVTDREWLYETAVIYEGFNQGNWIIVACADDKEEAKNVHDEWVSVLSGEKPAMLSDIYDGAEYYEE